MGERLLFRVAAGPRTGFGHLVRAVSLSRTLRVRPIVALRGGRTAESVARQLGCSLVGQGPEAVLESSRPSVLVVDDPNPEAGRAWVRAAHRRKIAVATIRDGGIGAPDGDLIVDGSVCAVAPTQNPDHLFGPDFMVLDPVFARADVRRSHRSSSWRVAVMLGGGVHAGYAHRVVAELERVLGPGRVDAAPGFSMHHLSSNPLPLCDRLAHARRLARAEVALVAGGTSLYEMSCLGIPSVAVAVAPAQRPAVRAFAALGAAIDGGTLLPPSRANGPRHATRLAHRVLRLLDDPATCRRVRSRARRVVDGRGSTRVAAALKDLAARPIAPESRAA